MESVHSHGNSEGLQIQNYAAEMLLFDLSFAFQPENGFSSLRSLALELEKK